MVLSKFRDLRFAPIAVVGPDAAEFFLVHGAVSCLCYRRISVEQSIFAQHDDNKLKNKLRDANVFRQNPVSGRPS